MANAGEVRLGIAGAGLGAACLGIGGYIASNSPGAGNQMKIMVTALFVTILVECGVFIFGIAQTFHRNFSIMRTGKPIQAAGVKAEVIPSDTPAIKRGIPAIIRALGPTEIRLALPAPAPAASGPQSPGADQPRPGATEPGSGPQ